MKVRIVAVLAVLLTLLLPVSIAAQDTGWIPGDPSFSDRECDYDSGTTQVGCEWVIDLSATCTDFSLTATVVGQSDILVQNAAAIVRIASGSTIVHRYIPVTIPVSSFAGTMVEAGIDLSAGGSVEVSVFFGRTDGALFQSGSKEFTDAIECAPLATSTPVPTETPTSVATPSATVTEPPAGTETPASTAEPTKAVTTLPETGQGVSQASNLVLVSGLVALVVISGGLVLSMNRR